MHSHADERAALDVGQEMLLHFKDRTVRTMRDCLEIIEFLETRGVEATSSRVQPNDGSQKWKPAFIRILRYIKQAHPTSIPVYSVLHIWDVPELDDINCNLSNSQFGKIIRRSKAAVNIGVQCAAVKFGAPPRRDQRDAAARQKMSEQRMKQLREPPQL